MIITDDITLLATATTALRDIHMGHAHDDVVTVAGGTGLGPLVVELITDLRGRGIDDDHGWDCALVSGIPVDEDAVPMDPHDILDDLCLATTGLRDLHEGWPADELGASDDGKGLSDLVAHLVGRLRGMGVDDEGGWDCDVTVGIPVARSAQP